MIRIGNLIICTVAQFNLTTARSLPDDIDRPAPAAPSAARLNRDLLSACMAADALFHRLKDAGLLKPADQIVCDQIVEAVGPALMSGL